MGRNRIKRKPILLLTILSLSFLLPILCVKTANATDALYCWGALQDQNSPAYEYIYQWYICYYVNQWAPSGWLHSSYYESSTYSNFVGNKLAYLQSNNIHTAHLWVGDFWFDYYYGKFHWLFCSGGNYRGQDYTWDSQIYYLTAPNSKQWFDFIWTCSCGGVYFKDTYSGTLYGTGPPNTNAFYGWYDTPHNVAVGMPYAWSAKNTMSRNGYLYPDSGNCVYIGWENSSPYLMDLIPNSSYHNYDFLYQFYYYKLGKVDGIQHSVHDSLDYASRYVFGASQNYQGCSYDNGWLNAQGTWSRLRVFGNSVNP